MFLSGILQKRIKMNILAKILMPIFPQVVNVLLNESVQVESG